MKLNYLFVIIGTAFMLSLSGCKENGQTKQMSKVSDTLYTRQAAMSVYAYQPMRALQIVDSAVIVGNLCGVSADICRARIYSSTLVRDQLDSLLHKPKGTSLEMAQTIGERLLSNDSVEADLKWKSDVLEILVNIARIQDDTLHWLQRSRELVDVCQKMGPEAETNALRTEAEVGAALCFMGQQEQGMAKLDSVINILNIRGLAKRDTFTTAVRDSFTFKDLDAMIIAMKRKIVVLGTQDKYAETLPLARRIIEQLEDYERRPEAYHDGSYREPKDSAKRSDYIRFYHSQAANFLTAAYTSLGENGNMLAAFEKIERNVRDAVLREHTARYNALQQEMRAERQRAKLRRANLAALAIGVIALLFFGFAIVVIVKNRTIGRKNRLLAQQITETINYKARYWQEKRAQTSAAVPDTETLNEEQYFQHIHDVVVKEKLYLDPGFGRQFIMNRFHLSKDRVGAIFSKGSHYTNISQYTQYLRLEYAAYLLSSSDESIVQIAADCGFSSSSYFSDRFRHQFGMSPTDFRRNASEQNKG